MQAPVLLALPVLFAAAPDPASDRYAERVLAALNRVRTQPRAVEAELRRYGETFRGRVAFEDDPDRGWGTAEGAAAVKEAASILDRQPSLPPLRPAPVLERAARAHAAEQARSGAIGHLSSAGRGPGDRVRAAGGDAYVTEAIAYGFEAPDRAVRQLLVDDGVPRRGHRVLMLNPRLRYAGVGCAPHPRLRTVCVIDFAETPDGSPWVPPSSSPRP